MKPHVTWPRSPSHRLSDGVDEGWPGMRTKHLNCSTQIILSVSQADGWGVVMTEQPYDFSPLTDCVRVVYTMKILSIWYLIPVFMTLLHWWCIWEQSVPFSVILSLCSKFMLIWLLSSGTGMSLPWLHSWSLSSLSHFAPLYLPPSRSNGSSPDGGRDGVRGGRWPRSPSRICAGRGSGDWWGWLPSTGPGWDYRRDRKRDCGGRGGRTRNLDQTDGLHHVLCGICCRFGQRVAVPVPLLQERWRWASESLCSVMLWHRIWSLWTHKLSSKAHSFPPMWSILAVCSQTTGGDTIYRLHNSFQFMSAKAGRRSGCNAFSVITSCYVAVILTHMLITIPAVVKFTVVFHCLQTQIYN